MSIWENTEHTLATGIITGSLIKAGLQAEPTRDPEGNYTSTIHVTINGLVYTMDVQPAQLVRRV